MFHAFSFYESGEKPGGKHGSGKKGCRGEKKPGLFWKRWKKAWCLFLGLIHIKINDKVKLTLFQPFDLKMSLLHIKIYFSSTSYFYKYRELCKIYYALYCFHPWCPDGLAGGRVAGNSLSGLYLRNRKV